MMAAVRFEVGIEIDAVESGCRRGGNSAALTMPGQKTAGHPTMGDRDYFCCSALARCQKLATV
jgi:hypothetical protein